MADEARQEAQRPDNWLLGSALTGLTTILTALGAVQLGLDRMLRNHPELVIMSFFFVILAALFGGIALTMGSSSPDESSSSSGEQPLSPRNPAANVRPSGRVRRFLRRLWQGRKKPTNLIRLGLVCFAIAAGLAVWAAVVTPADDEFPSITAGFKLGDRPALTTSIKAAGLTSEEDLDILIDGLSGREAGTEVNRERLYSTRLGPSPAGLVDISIEVPLPPAAYDRILIKAWVNDPPECAEDPQKDEGKRQEINVEEIKVEETSEPGCLIVLAPALTSRPQLSATWGEAKSERETLSVKLTGRDMRIDKWIAVNVVGTLAKGRNPQRALAQSVLVPNSQGNLEGSLQVPVVQGFTKVCIAAITVAPPDSPEDFKRLTRLGCPPKAGVETVWTMLRVPPRPFSG